MDRLLSTLLEAMRRATPAGPVKVLLGALGNGDAGLLRTLWPFMALEVVLGLDKAAPAETSRVLTFLGSLPFSVLVADSSRFATLLSWTTLSPTARLFGPPRKELTGLYEVILDMNEGSLARLVVDAYRADPPEDSAACALVAPGWGDRDRPFLARMLRERREARESAELHRTAAQVLISSLEILQPAGRTAPWALAAIRNLGVLRDDRARALVETILTSRRLLFLWRWPKPCREAAARARARRNLLDLTLGGRGSGGRR